MTAKSKTVIIVLLSALLWENFQFCMIELSEVKKLGTGSTGTKNASLVNLTSLTYKHESEAKEILMQQQEEVAHCAWKKNIESIKDEKLEVVFRLAVKNSEAIAGGSLKLPNGTLLYLDGSGVPVLWDLKEFLNLTIGSSYVNTWEEAWSLVEKGPVDLGVPLLTVHLSLANNGALKSVALLHPLIAMSSNVYFRPPPLQISHYLFFYPLQFKAWMVLLLTWSFSVFVCFAIHKFYNCIDSPSQVQNKKMILSELTLWTVAILCGKDFPVPRKGPEAERTSMSLRIAMLAVMLMSVMVVAVYTAKIMAIFCVKNDVIKSPEDLLKYKYTLASYSRVHLERIFNDVVKTPIVIQQALDNFISGEDALKKVISVGNSDPRYAFLTHSDGLYMSSLDLFSNHTSELCTMSYFTSTIRSPRSMYIKKGSKFREVLNWKILQLIERGINFRHQSRYSKQFEYNCVRVEDESFEELTIQQTLSMFLALVTGAILATLIAFIEWLV